MLSFPRFLTLVLVPAWFSVSAFAAPANKTARNKKKPASTSTHRDEKPAFAETTPGEEEADADTTRSGNGPATLIPLDTMTTTGLSTPNGFMNLEAVYAENTRKSASGTSTFYFDGIRGKFALPTSKKFVFVLSPTYLNARYSSDSSANSTVIGVAGAYHVSPDFQVGLGLEYNSLTLKILGQSASISASRPVVAMEYRTGTNQISAEFGMAGSGNKNGGTYSLQQEFQVMARLGLSGATYGILILDSMSGKDALSETPSTETDIAIGLGLGKKDLNVEATFQSSRQKGDSSGENGQLITLEGRFATGRLSNLGLKMQSRTTTRKYVSATFSDDKYAGLEIHVPYGRFF